MFGFWTIIAAIIGAVFFGRQVMYVTVLSVIALIPNFASETPVESEDEQETQFETDSWPEPSVVDKLNDQEQDW